MKKIWYLYIGNLVIVMGVVLYILFLVVTDVNSISFDFVAPIIIVLVLGGSLNRFMLESGYLFEEVSK